ncbi:MAG TPA: sigma-70 family RNA polymerase sigma factor, partial [Candidatus Omnitrophota bacterium]|nr:sigma-70 family RNA polymerase sigma factor [Candidatus Omnitrophota bacterium]
HDIGVIQHMAHLGNVVATPDGKIRIEDFEYGERVKDFTVQQEMAYRVNDIRGFFLNYIAHLNPRLIEDLKNVFEIDIYREFLKGYLGEFANDHNLVFASFGALQNALQEVTRAPGITDTHPLLFSVKQVVEKSRNNENNATENLLSSDDTPNPHAAGHVATFFDLLYKEENRGKPRSLMYLRKQVPSKMTGGDIAKLTAMQDLSKLKLAGLVRKKGEKSDSIYWSIIEDEKAINALYVRLSRLLASASTKDVQNAVREVIESLGGSIELIPGRKGNADEFVIHLPAKDGEGDEHDGYAFDERELDTINEKIVRWFYTGEGLEDGDYLITTLNVAGRKDIEVDKKMASFYVVPWNQVEKKDRSQVVFRAEDDINYGLVLNCYFLEDFERGKTDQPVVTYRYNPAAGKAVKVDLAAMEITDYYYGYRKVYSADRVYREVARKAGKSIYVRVGIPMGTKRTGDKEKSFMLPLPGDESLVGRTIIVTLEDDINQGQVINAYLGNESGEKREKLLITYKMKNVLEVGEDGKKEKRKAEEISLGGRDIVDIYEGRERELKICGRPFFANIQRLENGGGQVSVPLHWRGEKARYIRLYIDKKYLDESSFGKPVVSMVEDDPNHGQVINTYFVNEHGQKTGWPISTYKYDPDEIRILKYPAVKGDGHLVEKEKHGVSLQVDLGILDINRYISDKTDRNIAFIDRRPIEIAVYECDDHRGGVIYKAVHNRIDLEFQLENNAGDFFKGSGKPWKAICSLKFDEDYGLYIEISKDENILGRYYYLERLGRCTPVDFSKMALIDYVNGNKNIKGMDTEPRRYDHTAKVLNKGHVDIRARGQGLDFCRLTQLVGKYPIFIPERNGDDWEIKVYDREKYTESGQNEPAIVMVRNKFFKTLIPKNKREYFEAKEYYEQGFYGMAKRMLKDIQDRGEGDREITRLANEIDEVIVRLNEWLDMGIPFGDAETWEYYLKALVNALFCKDAIGAEKIKNMFVAGMSGKDGESLYGWLCARMKNRPENTVEVYVDIAILNILNNLQGEYQTNNISNKIAWLVSYEGMYKEDLHEALSGYCGSIPDSVAFKGMAEGIAAQPRSSDSIKRYNQEINAYPLLTAYGEFKFSVLSRLGDEKARERFINCNLRLARSIAGRFQWTGMPEQDLVSQANEGIIKAVEKFEPWRGIKFSTYAVWWCRQAVISYMQDQKKQIRIPVHKLEEIRKFVKQAKQAGFDPYSEYVRSEDIAEAVNMTFEKVEELRSMVDVVMSLDQTPQDKHGDSMDADFYSSVGYEDVGFSKIERSDIVDAITAEVEKCFPKKDEKRRDRMCGVYEQRLLPMLLGDEYKTYREVGAMLGVSHELVRHDIEPVVIDILKRVITDLGVTQEDLFVYTTNRAAAAIVRHPGRNRPDSDVDLQDGGGRSETPQNSAIKNGSIFHGEVNGILADSFENNKENIEYLIKDGQPVMKGVFADVYNEYDPGKKSKLRDLMYIRGRDFLHFKIDPDTGEVIGYQSEHVGKGRKNRYSSVYIGEGDYHALKDERSLVKEFLEHCIAHIDNPPRRGESEEAYEARIEKIMPTANVREKLFSQERIARARVLYLAGQRMGERAKTGSVVFDMSIVAEYVNWAKEFANPNDLEVEIGCGRGEYLLEQAEKYPGKNFIGIEDDREL